MNNLKERFSEMHGLDNFQRVDVSHPLLIYIGIDSKAQYSLFCVVDRLPNIMQSSKIVTVFIGKRRDGRYGITFSLTDQEFFDLFIYFCDDMIEASRLIASTSKAAEFFAHRYLQWQKAFAKSKDGLLPYAEIKGLVGEMCFLQNYMIPKYGEEKAISSWIGPDMADQDFVCDNTWYEVKSTVTGASSVRISSVEQLDTQVDGHLIVVRLDKTSEGDLSKITVNNLFDMIISQLSSDLLQDRFKATLLRLGYYANKMYDQYCFRYNGMDSYKVNSEFPCARKSDFSAAVQNVKYELSLPAIEDFRED